MKENLLQTRITPKEEVCTNIIKMSYNKILEQKKVGQKNAPPTRSNGGWLKVIACVPVAIPMKISTIDTGVPGKIVGNFSISTPN